MSSCDSERATVRVRQWAARAWVAATESSSDSEAAIVIVRQWECVNVNFGVVVQVQPTTPTNRGTSSEEKELTPEVSHWLYTCGLSHTASLIESPCIVSQYWHSGYTCWAAFGRMSSCSSFLPISSPSHWSWGRLSTLRRREGAWSKICWWFWRPSRLPSRLLAPTSKQSAIKHSRLQMRRWPISRRQRSSNGN